MSNERTLNSPVRENDVVYAVKRISDGFIKLGATQDLRTRLSTLRSAHGELVLLGVQYGYKRLEAELHIRFKEYRLFASFERKSGGFLTEWFSPSSEILDYISQNMSLDGVKCREFSVKIEWDIYGKLAEIAYSNGVTVEQMTTEILQFYADNIEPAQLPLFPPATSEEQSA